ncbi:MAG: hypothetical protein Q9219_004252 [cf. Caloplaca sp. 3 TL-2023]
MLPGAEAACPSVCIATQACPSGPTRIKLTADGLRKENDLEDIYQAQHDEDKDGEDPYYGSDDLGTSKLPVKLVESRGKNAGPLGY